VGLRQAELEGKGVADAHPILAAEHKAHTAGDVGIESEGHQVKHGLVVAGGLPFWARVKVEKRAVLVLDRRVDPPLRCGQPRLHLIEAREILLHRLTISLAEPPREGLGVLQHRID
jgi:hypothetical protein